MPRDTPPAPRHQRSQGRVELVIGPGREGDTGLRHLFHSAPLRVLFPAPDPGDPPLAALTNVAGGLAGGDAVAVEVQVEPGACLTIATPAAEKLYRSLGEQTEITTRLEIGTDASLEWLPQETILFDGARLSRRLEIRLAAGARLLAAEMLVFGRAAYGERFRRGALHDAWRLRRAGRLVWADALRLPSDPTAALANAYGFAGATAFATLVLAAPEAAVHRALARALAGGAATLPAPDVLVARWLGEAGTVRAGLANAIAALRAAALALPPRLPRLWTT
ncbi:MAG: urease accessory protein UreD [Acetobacteraceae bacterium]|nr:urease accessory protein UreD [Acetobacteraceae bacterium]